MKVVSRNCQNHKIEHSAEGSPRFAEPKMRIEKILDPETENFIFERTMAVVTTFYNMFSCGEVVLRFPKSSSANLGEPSEIEC